MAIRVYVLATSTATELNARDTLTNSITTVTYISVFVVVVVVVVIGGRGRLSRIIIVIEGNTVTEFSVAVELLWNTMLISGGRILELAKGVLRWNIGCSIAGMYNVAKGSVSPAILIERIVWAIRWIV